MIVWVRGIDGPGGDEFAGGGDVVERGTVVPFVLLVVEGMPHRDFFSYTVMYNSVYEFLLKKLYDFMIHISNLYPKI